jgi:hypothetical protein
LGIRIPDPGARKLRNFSGKMHLSYVFLKKKLPLKRYKIALLFEREKIDE